MPPELRNTELAIEAGPWGITPVGDVDGDGETDFLTALGDDGARIAKPHRWTHTGRALEADRCEVKRPLRSSRLA